MKKIYRYLAALPLAFLLIAPAQARHNHEPPRLRAALAQQSDRIERGIQRGWLTRWEARSLRRDQRALRDLVWAFRQDGYISRAERYALRHRVQMIDDKIYRFKRNGKHQHRGERHLRREHRAPDTNRHSPNRYWRNSRHWQ